MVIHLLSSTLKRGREAESPEPTPRLAMSIEGTPFFPTIGIARISPALSPERTETALAAGPLFLLQAHHDLGNLGSGSDDRHRLVVAPRRKADIRSESGRRSDGLHMAASAGRLAGNAA